MLGMGAKTRQEAWNRGNIPSYGGAATHGAMLMTHDTDRGPTSGLLRAWWKQITESAVQAPTELCEQVRPTFCSPISIRCREDLDTPRSL